MASAPYEILHNRRHVTLRSRVTSFLLAIAAEILLVLLLLTLSPHAPPTPRRIEPKTFSFYPSADHKATTKPSPRKAAAKKTASVAPPRLRPDSTTLPDKVAPPANPTWIDKDLFHAADISKLGSPSGASADADSGAAYGPGEGPGGERLYNAEWYREPTDAELSTYLPRNVPPGSWAIIACKTIDHFHVENCRQLGESPIGSGLSRAIRLAAWQFLVRPPRVGGNPVKGAWVRIRIDFTERGPK